MSATDEARANGLQQSRKGRDASAFPGPSGLDGLRYNRGAKCWPGKLCRSRRRVDRSVARFDGQAHIGSPLRMPLRVRFFPYDAYVAHSAYSADAVSKEAFEARAKSMA